MGSKAVTRAIFLIWIGLSILWAATISMLFLERWTVDIAPINRAYLLREQTCAATYRDQAARERCLLIMDLERFQERSIMIANRFFVVAIPPLIGLGVLVYLRRRTRRNRGITK